MARPIVLSNGEMHVGINKFGLVHDFYYPYVGQENHSSGNNTRHRVGVWENGSISWLDNGEWKFEFSFHQTALIGHTVAVNHKIGLTIEFEDLVDAESNAFMRRINLINHREESREVRLFMHQAFRIGNSHSNTDTAQFLPDNKSILHYRGQRAFVISGVHQDKAFDQHSIGLFGIENREGTWRDADDGDLSMSNIEHGRVDSTIRFCLNIDGSSSQQVDYWIAAGKSTREALDISNQLRDVGLESKVEATGRWWKQWLAPALQTADKVDPEYRQNFINSLMIIKSQIDNRGAIMASTDSAMLNYSRDAYAYCWPRDGSLVLWPLIRIGFKQEALRYFEFCRQGLHPNGYLMHKYWADGALGPSWHPYVHENNTNGAPIQEDETATTLFMFGQFYKQNPDPRLLDEYYQSMVQPMAEFMVGYIDDVTGLPKPTYDLWEEVYLTSTYTVSTVHAALRVAAQLAEVAADPDSAVRWNSMADDIRIAAHKYLYNVERKSFYKGIKVRDGVVITDETIDSSSYYGAFMFGLFDLDSVELQSAVETTKSAFGYTDGANVGMPRYENDNYNRVSPEVLGNWWVNTTLWLAQYYLETDKVAEAKGIMSWVIDQTLDSGVMSEQISPIDSSEVSVAPLTWSHSEFVNCCLDLISDSKQL